MSPELERIRKFDEVWSAMLAENAPLTFTSDKRCDACGKVSCSVIVSQSGKCVCADCYNVPCPGFGTQPTRHPQGDQLLRLPATPKFTKKFP